MKKFLKSKLFKGTLIFILVSCFIFFHFIGPKLIVGDRHNDKHFGIVNEYNIKTETIHIQSIDNLKMEALYVHSNILNETAKSTVIFLHGIGGKKERYLSKATELANLGIASLLIDLRAHGNSEGDYVTYGAKEVDDVKRFVKLLKTNYPETPLGIWGQSLGGAIALQTLAHEPLLDYGIIESTYSKFEDVVYNYSKRIMKVNLGYLNDYVIWRAQSIADFDKETINPIDACKSIRQRVLIVHGVADDRINISYGKANYENIIATDKEFLTIENANHVNVWNTGGTKYSDKTLRFILK